MFKSDAVIRLWLAAGAICFVPLFLLGLDWGAVWAYAVALTLGAASVAALAATQWPAVRSGRWLSWGPSTAAPMRRRLYWGSLALLAASIPFFAAAYADAMLAGGPR